MVSLSKEFVNNIHELSPVAIKCYIVLRETEELEKSKDGFVDMSYDAISTKSGIKSHKTIRESILELAFNRWIGDFKRGGYKLTGTHRINFSNLYKIGRNKVDPDTAKNVYEKMKGKDKSENLSG